MEALPRARPRLQAVPPWAVWAGLPQPSDQPRSLSLDFPSGHCWNTQPSLCIFSLGGGSGLETQLTSFPHPLWGGPRSLGLKLGRKLVWSSRPVHCPGPSGGPLPKLPGLTLTCLHQCSPMGLPGTAALGSKLEDAARVSSRCRLEAAACTAGHAHS